MKKSTWVLLLAIVLVAIGIWDNSGTAEGDVVSSVQVSQEEAPRVGYMAPSFELVGLDGETYKVGGKRDKPLFLNFWASWCGPCRAEAPDLVRLYAKYKDDLDMYSVNVTSSGDSAQKASGFIDEFDMINPVPMDTKGDVFQAYNGIAFPTNFLIDKNGVIRQVYIGMRPVKDIEKEIEALIKER
ncbi:TlpA family protein disulfide reductase [Paenibacillus marinisediminis]